jgi:hypothetical protein
MDPVETGGGSQEIHGTHLGTTALVDTLEQADGMKAQLG